MAEYHGHSTWIAVFFERNDGAVMKLNNILPLHPLLCTCIATPQSLVQIVVRETTLLFAALVMNNYSQPPPGKISEHGNGIGAPSPEEVERRAREIAMIDERNPDEFTEADWAQARHELMGEENNVPPEETPDNADMTEEWNVIASSKGHRIPRPGTEEEESVGEHLVIEGVEEATHDQMLEARREEIEQEGEIL
jgi:hypothetical protein